MALGEESPVQRRILGRVQGQARGGRSVPTRTTRLLVVRLETTGKLVVNDESHIGSVYAHPECMGRDHPGSRRAKEVLLDPRTLPGR